MNLPGSYLRKFAAHELKCDERVKNGLLKRCSLANEF
jgi:hypothetical protein